MKLKVLYIAPINISANASAGAETINIYINALAEKGHDVSVITFVKGRHTSNIKYNILNVIPKKQNVNKFLKLLGWIFYPSNRYLYKTSHEVRKQLKKQLAMNKCNFDVIILETTSAYLLWDMVKEYFPRAKIVASVHDIAYQGSYRKMLLENNKFKYKIRFRYFQYAKKIEVNALKQMDLIMPHNCDNTDILKKNYLLKNKEYFSLVPYYEVGYKHNDNTNSRDILFYGLMSRPENYESVLWFLKNVFIKLSDDYRFIIMGKNPPEILKQKVTDRIIVTGFVDDLMVKQYFENSLCMVVPLLYGSGIKTKVLSAFSSGLPILTNSIGIEGIPADKEKDYIFCMNASDYIQGINMLATNKTAYKNMCRNARKVTEEGFDHKKCADVLEQKLFEIVK